MKCHSYKWPIHKKKYHIYIVHHALSDVREWTGAAEEVSDSGPRGPGFDPQLAHLSSEIDSVHSKKKNIYILLMKLRISSNCKQPI